MKTTNKHFLVWGGLFSVICLSIILLDILILTINYYVNGDNISQIVTFWFSASNWFSIILSIYFIYIILKMLFTGKSLSLLSDIITKHRQLSRYLQYIGSVTYLFFIIMSVWGIWQYFFDVQNVTSTILEIIAVSYLITIILALLLAGLKK